jgi:hypothetical protein
MKAAWRIGMIVAITVLAATAAYAQSLKLQQRMASAAAKLNEDASYTNKTCGMALTATFDWAGAPEDDLFKYSPGGYCNAALQGIERLCREPIGRDAVKQIKSVTCGFGASREITLKDGTLDYKINFSSSNDVDFVYEALVNKL